MGDLSRHFSKSELSCRHCHKLVLNPELVPALEELRTIVGGPVVIHDGYRCPEHNAAVGGAGHSQHLAGAAADISIPGKTLAEALGFVLRIKAFGGIGIYPGEDMLHVDVRPEFARWSRIQGKYVSYQDGLQAILPAKPQAAAQEV